MNAISDRGPHMMGSNNFQRISESLDLCFLERACSLSLISKRLQLPCVWHHSGAVSIPFWREDKLTKEILMGDLLF